MKLSIIIVSWNVRDLLEACLDSVLAEMGDIPTETFVVDNASSDDTVALVREKYGWVRLIENGENAGFAAANNQAIRQSTGEFVLLLNPDTIIKSDGLVELVKFMETNPQAGAAGSNLLNPDGTLQPSCFPAPTLAREFWRLFHIDKLLPYALYNMASWDTTVPRVVDIVQGTSLLLRQTALAEVGLLDEDFYIYSEEVDMCYRLGKAGWELYWVPQSEVIHYGGQSTQQVASKMFLELYQNKLHYFRKHYGRGAAIAYKGILFASTLPRLLLTPLVLLERPAKRQKHLSLARNYEKLLRLLPSL